MPCVVRWPGVIKPGTVINDIFAHEDMLPTLMAAAGVPDVKEQLLKGMKVGDKTFKVHLDGYNHDRLLRRQRRRAHARSSSTSTTTARWWRCATTSGSSSSRNNAHTAATSGRSRSLRCVCPSSTTCAPIRSRSADHSMEYWRWRAEHLFLLVPAQQYVGQFLGTFKEFPPSQKAGSFSLDNVLESLQTGAQGANN